MARFTNIIESQGSGQRVGWSLDLSIVQVLKAPSGHGHNYYIRQGLEASYQRLSARTRLGLVSSARPFCLARLPAQEFFRAGRQAGRTGDRRRSAYRRAAATTLTPFMQLLTPRNFLNSNATYPFGADVTNYASLPTKPT
jgi:hypothetical protein